MMKAQTRFWFLLFGALLATSGRANAAPRDYLVGVDRDVFVSPDLDQAQNTNRPTLWLIGDSTVRNGRSDGAGGLWGWGDWLAPHFDPNKLRIVNRALGGRSSRTFPTEGLLRERAHPHQQGGRAVQCGSRRSGCSEPTGLQTQGVPDQRQVARSSSCRPSPAALHARLLKRFLLVCIAVEREGEWASAIGALRVVVQLSERISWADLDSPVYHEPIHVRFFFPGTRRDLPYLAPRGGHSNRTDELDL